VTNEASVLTGSKLVDNSKIYHDANYNFKDLIEFAEIQVGGSYRQYIKFIRSYLYRCKWTNSLMNMEPIRNCLKKFMDDRLKFTGSMRYDKAQNFDGNYSQGFLFIQVVSRKHNFRGSFQTGFRNHYTRSIHRFQCGVFYGSAPDNLTRFVETLPINGATGQGFAGEIQLQLMVQELMVTHYLASSVIAFSSWKSCIVKKNNANLVKPEG
jgi:hypothetical protein